MIRNSLICKLINVQASMKENNEKKIKNEDEISKLIKAFPKDIAFKFRKFISHFPVPRFGAAVRNLQFFFVERTACPKA